MRTLLLTILGLLFLGNHACAANDSYQHFIELYRDAGQAEAEEDYVKTLDLLLQSLEIIPDHPYIHYDVARTHTLLGDTENALTSLKKAITLGLDFGDQLDAALEPLTAMDEFASVQVLIDAMRTPINNSEVALTLPLRDLIPEGIAYDPVDECFYMGSIWKSKIVKFDLEGNFVDFIYEKRGGLRPVLGIRIDAERRILWAASEVSGPGNGLAESEIGWSGLFKFDLKTGALIKKYTLQVEGETHLFNDIALTAAGDAYVTDSEFGAVYVVRHDRDELELFLKSDTFFYPNGITMGADDNTLYMAASENGIFRIDIASKEARLLTLPDDVSHIGMDGIYYRDNSLVCVQNGLRRVSRIHLNRAGDGIVKLDVLETRNPHFIIPTTGAIAGDAFYYIANSQLGAIGADGQLAPPDQLRKTVILKVDL
ncbi:MAG: hypothetical protein GY835_27420 [bacterium]|nr:hypothetical protein [bacterium]